MKKLNMLAAASLLVMTSASAFAIAPPNDAPKPEQAAAAQADKAGAPKMKRMQMDPEVAKQRAEVEQFIKDHPVLSEKRQKLDTARQQLQSDFREFHQLLKDELKKAGKELPAPPGGPGPRMGPGHGPGPGGPGPAVAPPPLTK